jgi:phosphoribosylglycinamide formyltransferase-1
VKKIAILASGSGSNAENIANYFAGSDYAEVSFIIANNPNAFVLERAKR